MAGRPFLRAFREKLRDRGGWTALLGLIADGATLTRVAQAYDCSPSWLCHQLRDNAERKTLYLEARRVAAAINVDRAQDWLEQADTRNREDVAQAKLVAEHLRWNAARYDKDQFGETQPNVNVNVIGSLSLDALRWRTIETPALPVQEHDRLKRPTENADEQPDAGVTD